MALLNRTTANRTRGESRCCLFEVYWNVIRLFVPLWLVWFKCLLSTNCLTFMHNWGWTLVPKSVNKRPADHACVRCPVSLEKLHTGALSAQAWNCNTLGFSIYKGTCRFCRLCAALWYLSKAIWYDLFKGTLLFKLIPQRAIAQANDLSTQLDRQSRGE